MLINIYNNFITTSNVLDWFSFFISQAFEQIDKYLYNIKVNICIHVCTFCKMLCTVQRTKFATNIFWRRRKNTVGIANPQLALKPQ